MCVLTGARGLHRCGFVESLGGARQGRSRLEGSKDDLTALLGAIKQARNDFECAALSTGRFAKSPNDVIRQSANTSVEIYVTVATIHGGFVDEIVKAMDQEAQGRSTPRTFADRITNLTDLKDQMMKGLAQVAAVSLYAIVEFASEKPTGRLLVTKAQRQQLTRELEKAFGAAKVRKGLMAGLLGDEAAAAAIHGFLSDPKWRSRD